MSKESGKITSMGQKQDNGVWIGKDYGYEVEYNTQPKETKKEERTFDPMRGYGVGK